MAPWPSGLSRGGFETRLLRRLRAAGHAAQLCSARGLGDLERLAILLITIYEFSRRTGWRLDNG